MEFGGWRAFYEEIIFFHPFESGLGIGNFGMAFGKSQAHVDDLKLLPPGELHGFGRIGYDSLSAGGNPQNPFLEIESQQSSLFRIEFHFVSLSRVFDDIENNRDAIK